MQNESPPEAPKVEKKPKRRLLWIFLVVALVVGAGAGGALAGPRWMKPAPPSASAEPKPSAEPATDAVGAITELGSIIVDSKTAEGTLRHVKVALSVEHPEGVEPDAVKPYLPRGREAAIRYLRTHGFEELSTPQNFERVAHELGETVRTTLGPSRVERVLITDFVAQ